MIASCFFADGIGAIQYPLFRILAPWEEVTIPSCQDTRFVGAAGYGMHLCDAWTEESDGYHQVGLDLEPAQLAIVPQHTTMQRIVEELSTVWDRGDLPYLWRPAPKYGTPYPPQIRYLEKPGFVAALPPDTTTGVLRQHIIRLNSDITCTNLTESAWPSTCEGTNPFQVSFDFSMDYRSSIRSNDTIDICAPGDRGRHPWTLSRSSQEISEEVFFRFSGEDLQRTNQRNEVVHCKANTTRGYFELGNDYNGGEFGPLLQKWPNLKSHLGGYKSHDWQSAYHYRGQNGYWLSDE